MARTTSKRCRRSLSTSGSTHSLSTVRWVSSACTRASMTPGGRFRVMGKPSDVRVIDAELHLEEPLDFFDRNLEEPYRSMTRVAGPPEGRNKDGGKRFDLGGKV